MLMPRANTVVRKGLQWLAPAQHHQRLKLKLKLKKGGKEDVRQDEGARGSPAATTPGQKPEASGPCREALKDAEIREGTFAQQTRWAGENSPRSYVTSSPVVAAGRALPYRGLACKTTTYESGQRITEIAAHPNGKGKK